MYALFEWLKQLAPIGAVLVFAVALGKYFRVESWKKTEFVAKLYKQFSDDDDCKRALWFLQGDRRKVYYKSGDQMQEYEFSQDVLKECLVAAIDKGELTSTQLHIRGV
jgi:hypothetical protein